MKADALKAYADIFLKKIAFRLQYEGATINCTESCIDYNNMRFILCTIEILLSRFIKNDSGSHRKVQRGLAYKCHCLANPNL